MSINLDPQDSDGQATLPPGCMTTILTVLLVIVMVVTAIAVLLILKQRSEAMAVVKPTPTIGQQVSVGKTAAPTRTATGAMPTPTVPSARTAPAVPATTVAGQATRPPVSPTTTAVVGKTATAAPQTQPVTPVAGRTWYFGEGASVSPFRTWYSILNPGSQVANVTVTLYPADGKAVQRNVAVAAGSQTRVLANDMLSNSVFGAAITSDQPVYVERFTLGDRDGTTSSGLSPAKVWYFPEGETNEDSTVWLLVLNPGAAPANLTVTYMPYVPEDTLQPIVKKYVAPPTARLTIDGRKDVPSGVIGVMVESDQPIVVEESMYFDDQKAAYGGGGFSALSKTWYVASGNTQEPYTSRIAVLNPNKEPAVVKLKLVGSKGGTVQDSLAVPPQSKNDYILNNTMDDQLVAVALESDQPVAAQLVTNYTSDENNPLLAAYTAPASAAPARQWYLPEAVTDDGNDGYLWLFNPGTAAASATVTFYIEQGQPVTKSYTVAATNRVTIRVADEVAGKTVVAAAVSSTQPIVVERTTIFRKTVGATASAGIAAP